MLSRRAFLAAGAGCLLRAAGAAPAAPAESARALYAPAAEAVERGLAYLAGEQAREGALAGSFGTGAGQGHVAITALAGLAFLSGGHLPGRGRYGAVVERVLRYVLKQAGPAGLLNHRDAIPRVPMYSHGFATLLLAEAHGMAGPRELAEALRERLRQAVRLILDTQNHEGGWRYEPIAVEQADLSVTAAQAVALRAARNAGVGVPRAAVGKFLAYVKRCQLLPEGGFCYQPRAGPPTFPLTAAALVALHAGGVYDGPEVEAARRYLQEFLPTKRPKTSTPAEHWFYGHYYAAQAMHQAGGWAWGDWYKAIRDELCRTDRPGEIGTLRQQADGSWPDATFGPHYATAMACLILQVPRNCLPILQN
jgi:hypothetical protein